MAAEELGNDATTIVFVRSWIVSEDRLEVQDDRTFQGKSYTRLKTAIIWALVKFN